MTDTYKAWLEEQVVYYRNLCLKDAKANGWNGTREYPGIKYAHPEYRSALETYQECLNKYNELSCDVMA